MLFFMVVYFTIYQPQVFSAVAIAQFFEVSGSSYQINYSLKFIAIQRTKKDRQYPHNKEVFLCDYDEWFTPLRKDYETPVLAGNNFFVHTYFVSCSIRDA